MYVIIISLPATVTLSGITCCRCVGRHTSNNIRSCPTKEHPAETKKTTYLNLTLLPTDRQTDLQCLRTFRWWFWLWLWGGKIHSHSSWVSDVLQGHTSHFSLNHSSGVYQCSALRYLAHMKMLSGNLFWLYLKISSDHRHTQLLNISAGGFTVGLLTYCVLWRSRIIQTDWFTVKVTVCGACGQQMIQLHYSRVPDRWNH